jgi:hypothetical protein
LKFGKKVFKNSEIPKPMFTPKWRHLKKNQKEFVYLATKIAEVITLTDVINAAVIVAIFAHGQYVTKILEFAESVLIKITHEFANSVLLLLWTGKSMRTTFVILVKIPKNLLKSYQRIQNGA